MRSARCFLVAVLSLLHACAAAAAEGAARPIQLMVDATEAPRRIMHCRLVVPALPGALTLVYPKWLPGVHSPAGEIRDLAGLKFSAAGKPVTWQRDLEDMYALHCEVPQGASSLEVQMDFLSPVATAKLVSVNWEELLLYPKGQRPERLLYAARLRLPPGWKYGTALPVAARFDDGVMFQPVSLETLIDSPVIAGAHFKTVRLDAGDVPHWLHIVADSEAALAIPPDAVTAYQRLITQAYALFGARHYRQYHFLLTLSDPMRSGGLEHHESSNNRVPERTFLDDALRTDRAGLLPHEFAHSWNGKYRRPAGHITADFQEPLQDDLLWVYEGLTTYLGTVLSVRSGLWTPEQGREYLALTAARLDHVAGRTWRPLSDTAVAAPVLFGAPERWQAWRRGVDFYAEGSLIWLEADVLIRQKTGGRRSLDDFCRKFFGGQSGPPAVKPYTFDDIVAALGEVAADDWRDLLLRRLNATEAQAPRGGIEGGGWRLIYRETPSGLFKTREQSEKRVQLGYSLGLVLTSDGTVEDVIPGLPAAKAGLAPGMKLVAVNGRRYSADRMHDAIQAGKTSKDPLELLATNGDFYKVYRPDYHGGPRYPYLEREGAKPDLLSEVFRPRSAGK